CSLRAGQARSRLTVHGGSEVGGLGPPRRENSPSLLSALRGALVRDRSWLSHREPRCASSSPEPRKGLRRCLFEEGMVRFGRIRVLGARTASGENRHRG